MDDLLGVRVGRLDEKESVARLDDPILNCKGRLATGLDRRIELHLELAVMPAEARRTLDARYFEIDGIERQTRNRLRQTHAP